MAQQQQTRRAGSGLDDHEVPRRSDERSSARAPRRKIAGVIASSFSTLTLGAITLGVIGIGAMQLDPVRTREVIGRLAAWSRLSFADRATADANRAVSLQPRSAPRYGVGPVATVARPAGQIPGQIPGQIVIAYGDRLKISFFENISVSLGDPARAQEAPELGAIFPRMDLSGEYVVDDAGGLDIPRLARSTPLGLGDDTLKAQLGEAFERAFGLPCNVHVSVLDRQSVYVLGGPRGGATIKHTPSLIVLQALAEAGGYQRSTSDPSQAIEAIREAQRLGQAQDRLARVLVRQARLIALRDKIATVALPPVTTALLDEVLPQDAVAALLRDTNVMLAMERQAHADQLALGNRLVNIANRELVAQNLRLAQIRLLSESKIARLHGLEGLAARGSVPQFKITEATAEVAETVARQEDLRVAVAQAESRLAEAEVARAKVVQAQTSQVELDDASAEQEAAVLRRVIASMRAVVAVLGDVQGGSSGTKAGRPELRILRRGPDGHLLVAASDTTPLMPGDVLQIGPNALATQPDAVVASDRGIY